MARQLTLRPVQGPATEPVTIDEGRSATIGRRSANAVALSDDSVSREHAAIEWREVAWFVLDLGSSAGTIVSGERLEPNKPLILREADVLQIGRFVFRVGMTGPQGPAAQPAREPASSIGQTYMTRPSIFVRLRDDDTAVRELTWTEFRTRYAPVIVGFARKMGLAAQDADDVLQEVILAFFKVSPRFEYDPARGRFRGYLKVITRQVVGDLARRAVRAGMVAADDDIAGDVSEEVENQVWEQLWESQVFQRALEEARAHFEPRTMEAFELFALRGVPAEEVARRLDMPVNGVHHAKSRVLKVVREIAERIRAEEG